MMATILFLVIFFLIIKSSTNRGKIYKVIIKHVRMKQDTLNKGINLGIKGLKIILY